MELFEAAVEGVKSDRFGALDGGRTPGRRRVKLELAIRQRRLAALRADMAASDLDAVAIVPGASFQYLTGGRFSSMERPTILLVPAEGEIRAVMPALEMLTWEGLEIEAPDACLARQ